MYIHPALLGTLLGAPLMPPTTPPGSETTAGVGAGSAPASPAPGTLTDLMASTALRLRGLAQDLVR
jgi:hypothetical protein